MLVVEVLISSNDMFCFNRLQANKWCARGIELLATQRIEKCSGSAEIAEQSLQEIQEYLATAAEFKLSSPKEFKNNIQESTTLETKALVSQVSGFVFSCLYDFER